MGRNQRRFTKLIRTQARAMYLYSRENREDSTLLVQMAYAAVIYTRITDVEGHIVSKNVASKTRVEATCQSQKTFYTHQSIESNYLWRD